jgi:formylglycine-generating enzyme required for sulfatase activity
MFRLRLSFCMLFVALAAITLFVTGCPPSLTSVPNLVGMTQAEAETEIANTGLLLGTVTEVFSDSAPDGEVMGQDPAAGDNVKPGSAIDLTVSKGPEPTTGTEMTITLPGNVPMILLQIPAGTFTMGRYAGEQASYAWEGPAHQVTFAHDFYLGKYKVTQAQWQAVMGNNPSHFTGDLNRPVENVSWEDAQDFIAAVNLLGQGTVRLPSEAEWEYACRAGTTTRFFWGDDPAYLNISNYAWYEHNSASVTHPVGWKLANAWGLYDMNGDVWEWCQDWWHDDYTGAPTDGSAWESPTGTSRVGRGGAWNAFNEYCRSAFRSYDYPDNKANNIGFRIAM